MSSLHKQGLSLFLAITALLGLAVWSHAQNLTVEGKVGIGTNSPWAQFEIVGAGSGAAVPHANMSLETHVARAENNQGSLISLKRSGGSAASEIPILAADTLGTLEFRGYTGGASGSAYYTGASIHGVADVDYTTAGGSTSLRFKTGLVERMRITGGGSVGIGTMAPGAPLEVNGAGVPGDGIRLRPSTAAGSVDVFGAVGNATSRTGTALCESSLGANNARAVCLAHWDASGVETTCATAKTSSRALCTTWGN